MLNLIGWVASICLCLFVLIILCGAACAVIASIVEGLPKFVHNWHRMKAELRRGRGLDKTPRSVV